MTTNRIDKLDGQRRGFLVASAAALAAPAIAWARSDGAADAPALTLARVAPADIDPVGYLVSEKLDGVRGYWDGRTLRFRSGLVVPAPAWFTRALPPEALDGELWLGRARFEKTSGLVRSARDDDPAWRSLRFNVFEMPGAAGTFESRHGQLQDCVRRLRADHVVVVEQFRLANRAALKARLADVVRAGGEGLVLHRADAPYASGRSDALLKLKPLDDAEAVVLAHRPGRGKYAGQVGALLVRNDDGIRFAIGSGLSDVQRADPPQPGVRITYTYQGTTANGTPRFARLLRVRDDV